MELTPEQLDNGRWTRARLNAHQKSQPGDDLDELTRRNYDAQTKADVADIAQAVEFAAAAPIPTPEQAKTLWRLLYSSEIATLDQARRADEEAARNEKRAMDLLSSDCEAFGGGGAAWLSSPEYKKAEARVLSADDARKITWDAYMAAHKALYG